MVNADPISRVRTLEERFGQLNKKVELIEKNMVDKFRQLSEKIRSLDSDDLDLKREIDQITQKMELIIKELKLTAPKSELDSLKAYLDMWNPARFVTRKELEESKTL